jgi:hypothetical protein
MKETEPPVRIRPLQHSDIAQAMRLKNLEGWNQTEKDWEILLTAGTFILGWALKRSVPFLE